MVISWIGTCVVGSSSVIGWGSNRVICWSSSVSVMVFDWSWHCVVDGRSRGVDNWCWSWDSDQMLAHIAARQCNGRRVSILIRVTCGLIS